MSSPTLTNIVRNRGRLIADPTSLTGTFPFGGTALGLTRTAAFRYNVQTAEVTAEEFGNRRVEAVYSGEQAEFGAVIRDYDSDMITKIFPNTGSNGLVKSDKTDRGILLSTRSHVLVFAPLAEDDHPWIVLYRALPIQDEAAEIQLSANVEIGIAVKWWAIPDTSGRIFAHGPRAEISFP